WKTKPITKPTNVTIAVNKNFTVSFYALDGTTFVCSQVVQGGRYINGGDTALYNSWSSADALYLNYQLTDNLRVKADWLKDLDTGNEFNWKETTINSNLNVTIALEDQYNLPPSPVTPGEFVVEMPTLISLGFEWYIDGDDNGNATVDVTYREVGTTEWKEALPMLRINRNWSDYRFGVGGIAFTYITPNLFAGSIMDLKEDTEYECMFVMSDPDGVLGATTETVTVRTRPEPKPAEGGRVLHVYPPDWVGEKEIGDGIRAYRNLMDAYYSGYASSDWSNFMRPWVKPGDTILFHAGVYQENSSYYGSDLQGRGMGAPFDGTYYLYGSGTPERPIVFKAAGDGEVIFDGDGNHTLFNMMGADYHYFENLTFRNTNVVFLGGQKNIAGSSGLTVKNCKFEDVGMGVHTDWSGSKGYYIADNEFVGRELFNGLMGWTQGQPWGGLTGHPAPFISYAAVRVYGEGHVVCFNKISHFHDGINICTYGLPDGYEEDGSGEIDQDKKCVAIDFYNNDISLCADNFIESDGSMYNVRIQRNLCMNTGAAAISMQTVYGGPVYWIRNLVYHVPSAGSIKWDCHPSGGLAYNNTLLAEANILVSSNMHWRNNIIIAENPTGRVFNQTQRTNYSSSDYNGFGLATGVQANPFGFHSPDFTNYDDALGTIPRITRNFGSLEAYKKGTGLDMHSILVDHSIFVNSWVPSRTELTRVYTLEGDGLDFTLKPDSIAIDAGVFLPNVTEGYTGDAPDLGAYEYGKPLPHYGPRTSVQP
ncbi:MAG: hypothetical protein FWH28_05030, partial [Clostridiales bacterium]|nr:hypothetical protein [Clostridiales bacterium]